MKLIDDNGAVTLNFGGEKRTFKFGYKSLSIFEKLSSGLSGNIETIACLLYSGLLAKKEENKLPEDFSIETVLDWMDGEKEEAIAELFAIGGKRVASLTKMGQQMLKIAQEKEPIG